MSKQPAFPGLRHSMKKKQTRRENFLVEMDAFVPWPRILALIEPYYPKVGPKGGRPPMPLETMLRVYFLHNWYVLSDPMAEEMLYDSDAMRQFTGIELGDDRIPDETTILNFRHVLEKRQLTEKLFVEVNTHLADRVSRFARAHWWMRRSSMRRPRPRMRRRRAIPKCHRQKKGNDWVFGMKAHVGVDVQSGIVHSLDTTTAKVHDRQVWDDLLHGKETSVWAPLGTFPSEIPCRAVDKGYVSAGREAAFSGSGRFWGVLRYNRSPGSIA